MKALLILLLIPFAFVVLSADKDQAKELGTVVWEMDYAQAAQSSADSGKPLFLLFQEIPGCSTCTRFGLEVLSNPLLRASIQHDFIPMVVNNRPGGGFMPEETRVAVLRQFKEPAWNNPVVRFVNPKGVDLIPRADGQYSATQISARMIRALEVAKQDVPELLNLAYQESDTLNHKTAVVAMHCFWTGEARLGALNGVVNVEAGFKHGREVVAVTYHAPTISYAELIEHAEKLKCSRQVYTLTNEEQSQAAKIVGAQAVPVDDLDIRKAPASDRRHALRGSKLKSLDLTPAQLTKINAAIFASRDPLRWLTPEQRQQVKRN